MSQAPTDPDPASTGPLPAPRRGLPAPLTREVLDPLLLAAFAEDLGTGDITTSNVVPADARARAWLTAKGEGVLAGLCLFERAFELRDPDVSFERLAADGDRVRPGAVVLRMEGRARALLEAERTALNYIQRMSGIATKTADMVERVKDVPGARLLDTRKTTPGLRVLEKYAVRCGGGENHRYALYDEAMVKDNHVELAGRPLLDVLVDLRAALGPAVRITCEARDEQEAETAVRGGADVVLLDNMTPARIERQLGPLRALAAERGRPVELEASGGISPETVQAFAETGVDRISVGGLTHSAPALDLSLSLEPAG